MEVTIPISDLVACANLAKPNEQQKRNLLKWYIYLNTGFWIEFLDTAKINDKPLFNKNSKLAIQYFKTFQL